MYQFLSPGRAAASDAFLAQYRRVRSDEGRCARSACYYRALPLIEASDPHAAEWRIRQESYRTLLSARTGVLSPRSWLRVLDLGAGNGWLSNRLASLGHAPVAVDLLDDDADGLRTRRLYEHAFVAVRADFDALPFVSRQFDLVILNASLHYSQDPERTLGEAARVVAGGGALVVMDSPMFECHVDGELMVQEQLKRIAGDSGVSAAVRPGVGFLTFRRMREIAGRLGRHARFLPSRGPLAWRARRAWSRRRIGRASAAFGLWVAR